MRCTEIGMVILIGLLVMCSPVIAQDQAQPSAPALEAQIKNLQAIVQQQQAQIAELLKRTAETGDRQAADTLAAAFDQAMLTAEARRCAAARLPYRITYSPQAGMAIVCDQLVQPNRRAWWRLWLW